MADQIAHTAKTTRSCSDMRRKLLPRVDNPLQIARAGPVVQHCAGTTGRWQLQVVRVEHVDVRLDRHPGRNPLVDEALLSHHFVGDHGNTLDVLSEQPSVGGPLVVVPQAVARTLVDRTAVPGKVVTRSVGGITIEVRPVLEVTLLYQDVVDRQAVAVTLQADQPLEGLVTSARYGNPGVVGGIELPRLRTPVHRCLFERPIPPDEAN